MVLYELKIVPFMFTLYLEGGKYNFSFNLKLDFTSKEMG